MQNYITLINQIIILFILKKKIKIYHWDFWKNMKFKKIHVV